MSEIWNDIDGFAGYYQISSIGRVKSMYRTFGGRTIKERILATKTGKGGYLWVTLCKNGDMSYFMIHRLVACVFIPNPENNQNLRLYRFSL